MRVPLFLINRMSLMLDYYGLDYTFLGTEENAYHERVTANPKILRGIYHESNGYESQVVDDDGITYTFPTPMILCKTEDAADIQVDDRLKAGDKYFVVTAKNDIQNYGIVTDISLREVEPWQTDLA